MSPNHPDPTVQSRREEKDQRQGHCAESVLSLSPIPLTVGGNPNDQAHPAARTHDHLPVVNWNETSHADQRESRLTPHPVLSPAQPDPPASHQVRVSGFVIN